jgi:hypothetical protein
MTSSGGHGMGRTISLAILDILPYLPAPNMESVLGVERKTTSRRKYCSAVDTVRLLTRATQRTETSTQRTETCCSVTRRTRINS